MIALWLAALLGTPTAHAALPEGCETTSLAELAEVDGPVVYVLGERFGHGVDQRRAARLIERLADVGPVQVAVESVHRKYQPVIDAYAARRAEADDLPELLDFETSWGFSWEAYRPVLTLGRTANVKLVAAGLDRGAVPGEVQPPIPPRYLDLLRPSLGEHPLPLGEGQRLVTAYAFRDHALATKAVSGWTGRGALVVIVGSERVFDGAGVPWQLDRLVDVPVKPVILAPGPEPSCREGVAWWR